jgi:NNP family nitrate/nitrite transporter-like MFS transporter
MIRISPHASRAGSGPNRWPNSLNRLRHQQVWRFSLYYFFVFGAFVALALWLPKYLSEVYAVDVKVAGMLAAIFSLSASLFRAYGGMLSDKYGARKIMYATFGVSMLCLFMLSYPSTDYVIHGIKGDIAFSTSMGLVPFVITVFVLGFFMSLGKAAVYKHIPVYYPDHVGSVGGMVGMVGGLGGFVLPIVFGVVSDLTNIWTSCFMVLFALVAIALAWMHMAIRQMEQKASGIDARSLPQFPEMADLHDPAKHADRRNPRAGRMEARRQHISGKPPANVSHGATSTSRSRRCCSPFRCGWSGRWWSQSCR